MPVDVVVEARLSQPWYWPGDVVRATVTVWATDAALRSGSGKAPLVAHTLPPVTEAALEADGECTTVAARIQLLDAIVAGASVVDTLRLTVPSQTVEGDVAVPAAEAEPSSWSWLGWLSPPHPRGCQTTPESHKQAATMPHQELVGRLLKSLPTHERARVMFQSHRMRLMDNEELTMHRKRSVTLSATLPVSLPPSFSGISAGFYYGVLIEGQWTAGGQPPQTVTLRVPIKVYSPNASLTCACFPYAAPGAPLDEKVMMVPPLPSPAVLSPLHADFFPRDIQRRREGKTRTVALGEARRAVLEAGQQVHKPITLHNGLVATLMLRSSTAAVGQNLYGVLSLPVGSGPMVAVKAHGMLEMLECCPRDILRSGNTFQLLVSDPRLAVVQSIIVLEQEWSTLDVAQRPISIFVPPTKWTTTMSTDVVCVAWQLRIQLSCCRRDLLAQRDGATLKELRVEDEVCDVVVPLTIVPPATPEIPRLGQMVVAG